MRTVLYPSARRLTDEDLEAIDELMLCELVESPSATEMGRMSVCYKGWPMRPSSLSTTSRRFAGSSGTRSRVRSPER